MSINNIEIIRHFLCVADLRSLSKAADLLYISRSSLSRQIASLEEELGIRLFERKYDGLSLTEQGTAFYRSAKTLEQSFDTFDLQLSGIRKNAVHRLRIASDPECIDYVASISGLFLRERPELITEQIEHLNPAVLLSEGRVDIACVRTNNPARLKSFQGVCLGSFSAWAVLSADNSLAAKETLRMEELREEPFVLHRNQGAAPGRPDRVMQLCQDAGYLPKVTAYVNSDLELIENLVRHKAVSIIPHVVSFMRSDHIVYRRLEVGNPGSFAWLLRNPSIPNTYAERFMQFAEKSVRTK